MTHGWLASRKSSGFHSINFVKKVKRFPLKIVLHVCLLHATRRYCLGDAELVFSAEDFSNFLVHPLTVRAAKDNGPGGHEFVFDGGEGGGRVSLDDGAVCFSGRWTKDDGWYRVAMKPKSGGGVSVTTLEIRPRGDGASVENDDDGDDDGGGERKGDGEELAAAMAAFFGTLMIDLEGAQLTYRDMTVTQTLVELRLSLRVVSFPPPNAEF